MTDRIVTLMIAQSCQHHLPNGATLYPVLSNNPDGTNVFAVPLEYYTDAHRAGFLETVRPPQGPTSARPTSPAPGTLFFDWTLNLLAEFGPADAAWHDTRTGAVV